MKHFEYQAVTKEGQRVKGVVEAKSEEKAAEVIRNKGMIVTKMSDQDDNFSFQIMSRFSRIRFAEMVMFTRQLATMINSGLPIITALNLINKKVSVALKKVVNEIINQVEGGSSLYNSMVVFPDVFSDVYLALVKSGEVAGILDEVLDRLADTMEKQHEFRQKVKGAMIYPIIVTFIMIIAAGIMVFFIIPQIADLYTQFEADLPLFTEIVISVSMFIKNQWYIFALMFVGAIFGIMYFKKTDEGKKLFDEYILKVPLVGELQHKIISTSVMNTLALLVKSGVSIVESLEIVAAGANNDVYRKGILNASVAVEKGMSISAAFSNEDVFPEMIIQMMSVGEETGKLDDMLLRISEQYRKDSEAALDAVTKAIEPVLMVFMGVGVFILVIAVIVPIFNLTAAF